MERLANVRENLTLDTQRLKIRIFNPEDVTDEYVQALDDPEVVGLTESRYRNHRLTLEQAQEYATKSNQGNSIFVGIFLKDGRHIGNIRVHTISEQNKRGELGIMIWNKNEWGKGYATEALEAVVSYAFTYLNLHKVEAEYYSTNTGSKRIFDKAGFVIEGTIRDHFVVDGKYVDAVRRAKFNKD